MSDASAGAALCIALSYAHDDRQDPAVFSFLSRRIMDSLKAQGFELVRQGNYDLPAEEPLQVSISSNRHGVKDRS